MTYDTGILDVIIKRLKSNEWQATVVCQYGTSIERIFNTFGEALDYAHCVYDDLGGDESEADNVYQLHCAKILTISEQGRDRALS